MINKMFKRALALASITLISMSVNAATTLKFKEGEHLNLELSRTNYSRLAVNKDNITRLIYPDNGLYAAKEADGSVYVTIKDDKPFTLFITTEHGRHLYATVTPDTSQGKSIIFTPEILAIKKAKRWEVARPYERSIERLMMSMKNSQTPPGYIVKRIKLTSTQNLKGKLRIVPLKKYQGANLSGTIYRLDNNGSDTKLLKESDFFEKNIKAIALDKTILPAQKSTHLYIIRSNHVA